MKKFTGKLLQECCNNTRFTENEDLHYIVSNESTMMEFWPNTQKAANAFRTLFGMHNVETVTVEYHIATNGKNMATDVKQANIQIVAVPNMPKDQAVLVDPIHGTELARVVNIGESNGTGQA